MTPRRILLIQTKEKESRASDQGNPGPQSHGPDERRDPKKNRRSAKGKRNGGHTDCRTTRKDTPSNLPSYWQNAGHWIDRGCQGGANRPLYRNLLSSNRGILHVHQRGREG